jgi:hypothetical protein
MTKTAPSFDFIVEKIRKRAYGLLETVSPEEGPITSSVLYGVSPPNSKFRIYILTYQTDVKFRNIKHSSQISFTIPLCHRFICLLPFAAVYFDSNAEFIPFNDPEAQHIFQENRQLKKELKEILSLTEIERGFIRLKPTKKVLLYKPGLSLRSVLKQNEQTYAIIKIPESHY